MPILDCREGARERLGLAKMMDCLKGKSERVRDGKNDMRAQIKT